MRNLLDLNWHFISLQVQLIYYHNNHITWNDSIKGIWGVLAVLGDCIRCLQWMLSHLNRRVLQPWSVCGWLVYRSSCLQWDVYWTSRWYLDAAPGCVWSWDVTQVLEWLFAMWARVDFMQVNDLGVMCITVCLMLLVWARYTWHINGRKHKSLYMRSITHICYSTVRRCTLEMHNFGKYDREDQWLIVSN